VNIKLATDRLIWMEWSFKRNWMVSKQWMFRCQKS